MEAQAVPREAAAGWSRRLSPRALRLATDARLVALVRDGNRAAFEAIYDRYHRPILSFCRHMVGDPEEAADAVQHTFLAAYNAIVASEKSILLRAWLFTIARNRCYSVLRAKREQPLEEFLEPATEGLSMQVQRREDLRQLLSDMRTLPADQRAALVMAELGTLNHQEIGTALGVPPAKVKALVFQARESLIASRTARDTDCTEIRQQLSTLHGGALRRANLRRHLRECQGCREFKTQVADQRRSLAAVLPVVPAVTLKEAVLGGVAGTGTAGGALAGGGLLASTALKGLALKGAMSGLLALVGVAGTVALVHHWHAKPAAHHAPQSVSPPAAKGDRASAARALGVSASRDQARGGASSRPRGAGDAFGGGRGRHSRRRSHTRAARSGTAGSTGSPLLQTAVPAAAGVPAGTGGPAPTSVSAPNAPATPNAPGTPPTPAPPAPSASPPPAPAPPGNPSVPAAQAPPAPQVSGSRSSPVPPAQSSKTAGSYLLVR